MSRIVRHARTILELTVWNDSMEFTAGTVEDMELQEWRGVQVGPGRHVSLVSVSVGCSGVKRRWRMMYLDRDPRFRRTAYVLCGKFFFIFFADACGVNSEGKKIGMKTSLSSCHFSCWFSSQNYNEEI